MNHETTPAKRILLGGALLLAIFAAVLMLSAPTQTGAAPEFAPSATDATVPTCSGGAVSIPYLPANATTVTNNGGQQAAGPVACVYDVASNTTSWASCLDPNLGGCVSDANTVFEYTLVSRFYGGSNSQRLIGARLAYILNNLPSNYNTATFVRDDVRVAIWHLLGNTSYTCNSYCQAAKTAYPDGVTVLSDTTLAVWESANSSCQGFLDMDQTPPLPDVEDFIDLQVNKYIATGQLGSVTNPASENDVIQFTIEVENTGNLVANSVVVTDLPPSGSYGSVSGSATQGSYSSATGVWTVGTLQPGEMETLTVTATLITPSVYPQSNCAEVTGMSGTDVDSTPGDSQGDDYACSRPRISSGDTPTGAVLDLSKSAFTTGPVGPGHQMAFHLYALNAGNAAFTEDIVVFDYLNLAPNQYDIVAVGAGQFGCNYQGTFDIPSQTWLVPALGVAESACTTIVIEILEAPSGQFPEIQNCLASDLPLNNYNNLCVFAKMEADTEVVKEIRSGTEPTKIGDVVVFDIEISTDVPGSSGEVAGIVNDLLDDTCFEYVSHKVVTPNGGTYDPVTGIWEFDDLDDRIVAAGGPETFHLEIFAELTCADPVYNCADVVATTVKDPIVPQITGTVAAVGTPIDNNLDNNLSCVLVDLPRGDIQVTKALTQGSDGSGVANWEFQISSSNCLLPSPYDTNPVVTVDGTGGTAVFNGLMVTAESGSSCQYTVEEINIPAGWETTSTNPQTSLTVTADGTTQITFTNNQLPIPMDYGDAPDAAAGTATGDYNTTSADNGPSHVIIDDLRLGLVDPDADDGTNQNAAADADDTDVLLDDEDGVSTLPSVDVTSTSVPLSVSVFNNTGSDATVACYIDFNRDGDFTDAGESATATVSSSASQQTANLTFSGFGMPMPGDSYLRCRIANDAGEASVPTGSAATGEVEDYPITITGTLPTDYGDAPDTGAGTATGNYETTAADGGPSHIIVDDLRLGLVDPDDDDGTNQNATADADDNDASPDDEDGVSTLPSVDETSTSVPLSVSVFNNTGSNATVACYIDFNRDGDFTDAGEIASTTVSSSASQQTVNLTFSGFGTPVAGDSYLRCRVANAAGEATVPTGAANTGEVEDYPITIESPAADDYGDAPDTGAGTATGNYETTATDNGPSHTIVEGLQLGAVAPDADDGTNQNVAADADDTDEATDDEDGVATLPAITTASTSVSLDVSYINDNAKDLDANIACFIDFNRDGDFTDAGESAIVAAPASATLATANLTFSGFATPVAGDTYLRCRIAYEAGEIELPTGAATSGEIEDYLVAITVAPDYGDAPDTGADTATGNYETTAADNGPSHIIIEGLQLGAVAPDADDGTNQNAAADADDTDEATDDEDGVTTLPAITTASTSISLDVDYLNKNEKGVDGYVACFIDFNRDGDFTDAGERAVATAVATGTVDTLNLAFSGFATPVAGDTYLRCRIALNETEASVPTGPAATGEVEDYLVTITEPSLSLGSTVFLDSNRNGLQDGSEAGISSVTVELYTSSQTPGVDTPIDTDVTDNNGDYFFDGLAPDDYVVYIPTPPATAPLSSPPTDTADNDEDGDDNGIQSTSGAPVSSPVITLSVGSEPVNGTGPNDEADQGANVTGDNLDDADDSNGNMTVDFGFVQMTAAIGNQVWIEQLGAEDNDFDFGVDTPVGGVTVQLMDANGGLIAQTTTFPNGQYYFLNVPEGNYYVQIPTSQFQTGGPLDDSVIDGSIAGFDSDPATDGVDAGYAENGVVRTETFYFAGTTNRFDLDFGFLAKDSDQTAVNLSGISAGLANIWQVMLLVVVMSGLLLATATVMVARRREQ